jgi:hypothetical protein
MTAFLKTIALGIVLAASLTLASCAGTADDYSGSSGAGMMPMLD